MATTHSREQYVFLAKLAEQAERYDGNLNTRRPSDYKVYLLIIFGLFRNCFKYERSCSYGHRIIG